MLSESNNRYILDNTSAGHDTFPVVPYHLQLPAENTLEAESQVEPFGLENNLTYNSILSSGSFLDAQQIPFPEYNSTSSYVDHSLWTVATSLATVPPKQALYDNPDLNSLQSQDMSGRDRGQLGPSHNMFQLIGTSHTGFETAQQLPFESHIKNAAEAKSDQREKSIEFIMEYSFQHSGNKERALVKRRRRGPKDREKTTQMRRNKVCFRCRRRRIPVSSSLNVQGLKHI